MVANSEKRISILTSLLEQTNASLEKLTGDIVTLSYPLEVDIGDENPHFHDVRQPVKGTRVECRIKLDEKGEISQILSAQKITYMGENIDDSSGFRYDEKIEGTEEFSVDKVDKDA